jgi:hypothetical protein
MVVIAQNSPEALVANSRGEPSESGVFAGADAILDARVRSALGVEERVLARRGCRWRCGVAAFAADDNPACRGVGQGAGGSRPVSSATAAPSRDSRWL